MHQKISNHFRCFESFLFGVLKKFLFLECLINCNFVTIIMLIYLDHGRLLKWGYKRLGLDISGEWVWWAIILRVKVW